MLFDRVHIIKKMLETGVISRSILSQVIITCRARKIEILKVLANYSGMTSGQTRLFFQDHFGLTTVHLDDIVVNPSVARLVPADLAMTHRIIPAFKIKDKTHLAMADPFNLKGLKDIRQYTGQESCIFLSPEDQVVKAIRKLNPGAPDSKDQANSRILEEPLMRAWPPSPQFSKPAGPQDFIPRNQK